MFIPHIPANSFSYQYIELIECVLASTLLFAFFSLIFAFEPKLIYIYICFIYNVVEWLQMLESKFTVGSYIHRTSLENSIVIRFFYSFLFHSCFGCCTTWVCKLSCLNFSYSYQMYEICWVYYHHTYSMIWFLGMFVVPSMLLLFHFILSHYYSSTESFHATHNLSGKWMKMFAVLRLKDLKRNIAVNCSGKPFLNGTIRYIGYKHFESTHRMICWNWHDI